MARPKPATQSEAQAAAAVRASWRRGNDAQRSALDAALRAAGGDRRRAAQALGVDRATVQRWLRAWPDLALRYPPPVRPPPTSAGARKPRGPAGAACLAVLGLAWPCSRGDVVAAWRRAAFAAHPDGGGSTAAFVRARRAYEAALALVRAHAHEHGAR